MMKNVAVLVGCVPPDCYSEAEFLTTPFMFATYGIFVTYFSSLKEITHL